MASQATETRTTSSVIWQLIKLVTPSVLLAGLLVVVLEWVSSADVFDLRFAWWEEITKRLTPGSYESFVAAVTQVGGTFLALYFATVGVVASTAYATAPGQIRSLFVLERASQVYVRAVALLVSTSIIVVLWATILGQSIHALTILFVGMLAIFSVLSLVVLGFRTFNFFDPTSLAEQLHRDLDRWTALAVRSTHRHQDESFQAHFQQRAEITLDTYLSLVKLTAVGPQVDHSRLATIGKRLLGQWAAYSSQKSRIPTQSRWFERVHEHPDWLTVDHIQLDLALQTETSIQPKEVPSPMWMERRLLAILEIVVKTLSKADDKLHLAKLAGSIHQLCGLLGRLVQTDEAHLLLGQTSTWWFSEIVPAGSADESVTPLQIRLALADFEGLSLIAFFLGVSDWARGKSAESEGSKIDAALDRVGGIYRLGAARKPLAVLEEMAKGLEFERKVEGRTVTPAWYPRHVAARSWIQLLDETVETFLARVEGSLGNESDPFDDVDEARIAAVLNSRGLELCNKMAFHLPVLNATLAELTKLKNLEDIYWPKADFSRHLDRVKTIHDRLVTTLSKLASALAGHPRSPDLPDFFGQAYALLISEIFNVLMTNRIDLFRVLFPRFFESALAAHDRLRKTFPDEDPEIKFMYAVEPVLDLIELSGYALFISQLDGEPFWEIAETAWDGYLENHSDSGALIEFLFGILEARSEVFAIGPRDLERSGRSQALFRLLRERDLVRDRFDYFAGHDPEPVPHESPIVRVFASDSMGFMEKLEELFAVEYLREKSTGTVSLNQSADSLARQLTEERGIGDEETPGEEM